MRMQSLQVRDMMRMSSGLPVETAVPVKVACALAAQRRAWPYRLGVEPERHRMCVITLPAPSASRNSPALVNGCSHPCHFAGAYPWFPEDFPWRDPHAGVEFVVMGGAAAHLLHRQGYGDIDFFLLYADGRRRIPQGRQLRKVQMLIRDAVLSLRRIAEVSVVFSHEYIGRELLCVLGSMFSSLCFGWKIWA